MRNEVSDINKHECKLRFDSMQLHMRLGKDKKSHRMANSLQGAAVSVYESVQLHVVKLQKYCTCSLLTAVTGNRNESDAGLRYT